MREVEFCKFHGFGNDYLVFEKEQLPPDVNGFAKRVCERHVGVGADGIAVLERSDSQDADYKCAIFNPDGSEASFSGNGTRCAVAYLYFKNRWSADKLRLSTLSGVKVYTFLKREGKTFWFETELGKPSPIECFELQLSEQNIEVDFVDVGNPVCVVFTDDFESLNWRQIGKEIENHSKFPARTNVVFVKPASESEIEIRIWERGAGETSSSGTCSIAAAVTFLNRKGKRRQVLVNAVGGTTQTAWDENDLMLITGKAELVFCGRFFYV